MVQRLQTHCYHCGQVLSTKDFKACSVCNYPRQPEHEKQFLNQMLEHLHQLVLAGGAHLTIGQLFKLSYLLELIRPQLQNIVSYGGDTTLTTTQLISTYQARLQELQQTPTPQEMQQDVVPQETIVQTQVEPDRPSTVRATIPTTEADNSDHNPVETVPPQRTFSLGTFFANQTITIVALLGAFLILTGALSFIVNSAHDMLHTLLIVTGLHVLFGGVGVGTYRFQRFRLIARIYTVIAALLLPLVAYAGFTLLQGRATQISAPALLTIAALYAAVAYGGLAVFQRFRPFAYLSMLALVVADLALARTLALAYWWWPAMLMPMALPALLSLLHPAQDRMRLFTGSRAILRQPIRILMYCIVVLSSIGSVALFVYSLKFASPQSDIRFALLSVLVLLLLWRSLFIVVTKRTQGLIVVAYLFVICILACCYALDQHPVTYAVVLTAIALLYYGLHRLPVPFLRLYHTKDKFGLHMDQLALLLVSAVPVICNPLLPFQFLELAGLSSPIHLPLIEMHTETLVELTAMSLGILLTIVIGLSYAQASSPDNSDLTKNSSKANAWPWLLLLSGLLLTWEYGTLVILFHTPAMWSFLGLTLLLLSASMAIRHFQRGARWSNPLDVLVLGEAMLTIFLNLPESRGNMYVLLLFFAVLSYGVVLYQPRSRWLFLPLLPALMALWPLYIVHPWLLPLPELLLPLAAGCVQRFITRAKKAERAVVAWEWPLVAIGLIYAGLSVVHTLLVATGRMQAWAGVSMPTILEFACLALAWYIASLIALKSEWLFAVVIFVLIALIVPNNAFLTLVWIAPVALLLYICIRHIVRRHASAWDVPLYITVLVSTIMVGVTGYNQGHMLAASWFMLIAGMVFYTLGLVQNSFLWLWLTPIFCTWSIIYSALLGDFSHLPVVTVISALLGLTTSFINVVTGLILADDKRTANDGALQAQALFQYSRATRRSAPPLSLIALAAGLLLRLHKRYSFLGWHIRRFAQPLYVTAIAAAVVTGLYGLHSGANKPFYAVVPTTLLIYAAVAYSVLLLERHFREIWHLIYIKIMDRPGGLQLESRSRWILLVTGLAVAGMVIGIQTDAYYVSGAGLIAGLIALLAHRVLRIWNTAATTPLYTPLRFWCMPGYIAALVTALTISAWPFLHTTQPEAGFIVCSLFAFTILASLTMYIERLPAILLCAITLAGLALWHTHLPYWQLMIAYNGLCVLIFATQFFWRRSSDRAEWLAVTHLHRLFGIGGQIIVIGVIMHQGGLFSSGSLAHVGAGSVAVLALMLFWYGHIINTATVRHYCNYVIGLLVAFLLPWELLAWGYTSTSANLFFLIPASYITIIAPFVMRDKHIPAHRTVGRFLSIMGAALLLLPALTLSFSNGNLLPTLILVGEAFILLILGIATRLRLFVLGGASLIIVGALHSLFLPSIGMPTPVALTLLGGILLVLAAGLSLAGRQLQIAWQHWE